MIDRESGIRNPIAVSLRTPEVQPAGRRSQQHYPTTAWNSPYKRLLVPSLLLQLCPYTGKEGCFPRSASPTSSRKKKDRKYRCPELPRLTW